MCCSMISRRVQAGILFVLLMSLGACAGLSKTSRVDPVLTLEPSEFRTEVNHWPEPGDHALDFLDVYDPWEPMNRNLYDFNAVLDEAFVLPVTKGYETVIPSPVRKGVNNVIGNLNELPILVNCLLQGKIKKSAITTSRFLINTTMGIGGLMDLASGADNLKKQEEDVGQTLGVWGFSNGPYFVMPLFGPSNVRDTVGFGGDFLLLLLEMKYTYRLLGVKNTRSVAITELVIRALNRRSNEPFRYHSTGSPFEYEMIRFIYTKKRELDIKR